ncbi:recombinase family protein [Streptomyces sp. NPDC018019]|uniref:recombinase family protein n=1 Tax=Streptomyces sp. NPDC018019 TaxID=3365030 RepID=UPI00379D5EB8
MGTRATQPDSTPDPGGPSLGAGTTCTPWAVRAADARTAAAPTQRHGRVADLVYKRVSTDQQSTARQNLVPAEAGIEDPVVFEEDPGTSSRLHPFKRPKFGELLAYVRPGDTVHISEMFRLVPVPATSSTCSTSSTATALPCASTTARSPRWTLLSATRAPASCCPL